MSQQPIPLTAEGVFEMFREVKTMFQETDRRIERMSQETDRKFQETDRRIGSLTSRIGEIVENMVGGGNIVKQFQTLNVPIHAHSRNKVFGTEGTEASGEIDVFLENGDVVVLIEVKTRLTDEDVRKHVKQMEEYRLYGRDKRRILGAVAGAVVSDDVIKFAHRQGLYVIVQSGEAVEIITSPEGFVAKEW